MFKFSSQVEMIKKCSINNNLVICLQENEKVDRLRFFNWEKKKFALEDIETKTLLEEENLFESFTELQNDILAFTDRGHKITRTKIIDFDIDSGDSDRISLHQIFISS